MHKKLFKIVGSLLVACLIVPVGSTAALAAPAGSETLDAEQSAQEEFDAVTQEITSYVVVNDNGTSYFDTQRAVQDGASSEVLAGGEQYDLVAASYQQEQEQPGQVQVRALKLPVWGNWCGPGHGGGKAKDTLDTLCMRHDKCYAERGYFDCACDAQLKAEIKRFSSRMSGGEKATASAITAYFNIAPCNPF